ncbi:MAG: ATP-binding protein [Desulfobulbaceae bacterium]|nr:ATP-binding protein [Desulfobulbaceae bacterium]
MQKLVVKTIEWGCEKLAAAHELTVKQLAKMLVVGNPAKIHLFLGVDPAPIGVAPYAPAFYDARKTDSAELGFGLLSLQVYTLPQVSGFIGGDILAATLASDISEQPEGTLIVDIGTNGEIVYKSKNGIYATSCATGPAFEGASISCGMQAIQEAIEKVVIRDCYSVPATVVIKKDNSSRAPQPTGLCGSGVISVAAELYRTGIVEASGAFVKDSEIIPLSDQAKNGKSYFLSNPGGDIGNWRGCYKSEGHPFYSVGKGCFGNWH